MHPSTLTLQECLAQSDVVVGAVPSASYKVKTDWLKDGCICLNVAADKNFEKDVREKVRHCTAGTRFHELAIPTTPRNEWTRSSLAARVPGFRVRTAATDLSPLTQASLYMPTIGKVTIMMLLRNLYVFASPSLCRAGILPKWSRCRCTNISCADFHTE